MSVVCCKNGRVKNPKDLPADVSQPIRVVVIDDDALVRTLLGRILTAKGLHVVGEGESGASAPHLVTKTKPDVVLMDLRMEGVDGIEATRRVRRLPDAPGVVALTSFDTEEAILSAVEAGVAGFLAKDASPEEIVGAIQGVASGEGALSPRAARVVLQQFHADGPQHDGLVNARKRGLLTEREKEAADLVSKGLSNSQIAETMMVGEATVKTHLAAAMRKLGVGNRVQLAVAVAAGD